MDHTADVAVEVWAEDEPGLLEEAARAVVALMTEGAEIAGERPREVRVEAMDAEERLVAWLNEVVFWATVDGYLVARAELSLDGESVVGRAFGEADAAGKLTTELKSATYHDLRVERGAGGVRARVVLDV